MLTACLIATALLTPAAEQLADRAFARREAADRLLAAAGWLAPLADRPHHDAEVLHRLRRLRGRRAADQAAWYDARAAALLPAECGGRFPWLALPDYGTDARAWVEARVGWSGDHPEYDGWREAARLWAAARLAERRPPAEVAAELRRMADAERRHRAPPP